MTRPTVSIAMATYNGGRFIEEQLDSFVRQTLAPDELVITDDGSDDRTLEILERFATSAPFKVHVHRNAKRLNYSRNFERAIGLCSSDILFLSDQDDVWFPEKIATVAAQFEKNPDVSVVVNDQILTDAQLNHTGVTKLGNLERIGKNSDGLVEGCCTALRRSFAEQLFPLPDHADGLLESRSLSHDVVINQLAILLGVRSVIRRPLQFFRRTGENATSWVLSEPRPTSRLELLRGRLPAPPTSAWQRRAEAVEFLADWIRNHPDVPGNREIALAALAHERRILLQRVRLAGMAPVPRAGAIWRLWRSGGYRYFGGWMSAVNDLTRTTPR